MIISLDEIGGKLKGKARERKERHSWGFVGGRDGGSWSRRQFPILHFGSTTTKKMDALSTGPKPVYSNDPSALFMSSFGIIVLDWAKQGTTGLSCKPYCTMQDDPPHHGMQYPAPIQLRESRI